MNRFLSPAALAALLLLVAPVFAHTEHGAVAANGFVAGLSHPLFGWDHVAAMVAVGLWGAFLGRPAVWLLPVVFPLVMALAAAVAVVGVPLPGVEAGIAASALALGLPIVFGVRPPLWIAGTIVGAFAIFHGHAHGAELPEAANAFAYSVGFVISTAILHAAGIALGLIMALPRGELAVRGGGALISLAGVGFLVGVL